MAATIALNVSGVASPVRNRSHSAASVWRRVEAGDPGEVTREGGAAKLQVEQDVLDAGVELGSLGTLPQPADVVAQGDAEPPARPRSPAAASKTVHTISPESPSRSSHSRW